MNYHINAQHSDYTISVVLHISTVELR